MIVTGLERQRRRRVALYVDGRFALTLGVELALDLRPGRALTAAELVALAAAEARRGALELALRLLSYRPRAERELHDRLRRKGFDQPTISATLGRLRELGYLDDAAFARFWAETRQATRPRSRRLLARDLRRRGVSQEQAEEATADISDDDAAHQVASRRLPALRGLERRQFRERLGRFLTGRGFSYEVARRTIERCWRALLE